MQILISVVGKITQKTELKAEAKLMVRRKQLAFKLRHAKFKLLHMFYKHEILKIVNCSLIDVHYKTKQTKKNTERGTTTKNIASYNFYGPQCFDTESFASCRRRGFFSSMTNNKNKFEGLVSMDCR